MVGSAPTSRPGDSSCRGRVRRTIFPFHQPSRAPRGPPMRTVTLPRVVPCASLFGVWGLARLGISFGEPLPGYTVTDMQSVEEERHQLDQRQQRSAVFSARLEAAKQDLVQGT